MEIEKSRKNPTYKKIYMLWYNMKRRCLDEKSKDYKYYGAKGVKICEKWMKIDGFIEEVDKIKGFSQDLFLKGELVLDKDGKFNDCDTYSLKTCEFLSKEESNKRKPSQQKEFSVYIDGVFHKNYFNQSEASRELGIRQSAISKSLVNGKQFSEKIKFHYV